VDSQGWIGRPVKRREDLPLVQGRGEFVDNIKLPGMAHLSIVRSPYPHARIVSIDTKEARKNKDVFDVITGQDVFLASNPILSYTSPHTKKYCLAVDKVRHVGEPVAAVVASDGYTAEDVSEQVHVEYEPLDVVESIVAAERDEVILHDEAGSNTLWKRAFNFGDTDGDFAKADRTFEEEFTFDRFTAAPIETFRCVADFDEVRQSLTVWSNFIQPGRFYGTISELLKKERLKIRLVCPNIGGAFGVQRQIDHMVLTCIASMRTGHPVKYTETRTEHLMASYHCANRRYRVRFAAKNDGTLLSCDVKATDDVGAYIVPSEPVGLVRSMQAFPGPYKLRSYRIEYKAVATNKCPSNSIRGYGMQPHCFMLERMVDIISKRLKIDPAELRARNLIQPNEFPYTTPNGSVYDSGDYPRLIQEALKSAGYKDLRKQQAELRRQGKLFGIGLAVTVEPAASNAAQFSLFYDKPVTSGSVETAMIIVDQLGRVRVSLGTAPHGQGHETTAAQIVADELGVSMDDVYVLPGFDSASHPFGASSGTYSSRFAGPAAGAIVKSARALRKKILEIASHRLGVPSEELSIRDGMVTATQGGVRKSMTVRQVAELAYLDTKSLPVGMDPGLANLSMYDMPNVTSLGEDGRANLGGTYASSAHLVTTEIDPETGVVAVKKYVAVADCGRIINPPIVEGQTVGGIVQALGWVLLEQLPYVDGQLLATDFTNYLMPTMTSFPDPVVLHVETPTPYTALGSKGVGESSNMTAMAAVTNSLEDALDPLGIKITRSHYSAAYLLELIKKAVKADGRS